MNSIMLSSPAYRTELKELISYKRGARSFKAEPHSPFVKNFPRPIPCATNAPCENHTPSPPVVFDCWSLQMFGARSSTLGCMKGVTQNRANNRERRQMVLIADRGTGHGVGKKSSVRILTQTLRRPESFSDDGDPKN
jgi:hypothetical protein